MAKRTGLPTIVKVAKRLCQLVAAFSPIIKKTYPTNTALHDALDTVSAACSVLVVVGEAQLPVGD